MLRSCVLVLTMTAAAFAANTAPAAEASDETIAIEGVLHSDPADVAKLLGRDPGFPMIVVELKVRPQGDTSLKLWRDDFTLLSNKDGQRSQPLSPSQLAGAGALKINKRAYQPAVGMADPNRPIYPDITGTTRPRAVGNDSVMAPADTSKAEASTDMARQKADPLLDVLKEKVMPEKETKEEVNGLLFFVLEGKHKPKHLELIYKSEGRQLILDFQK